MSKNRRTRKRKLKSYLAIEFTRAKYGKDKIVYLLTVNRPHRYSRGSSHIVYIGTSKNGVSRVAASSASKGRTYLESHGIKKLSAYVVPVPLKPNVRMWEELESALLLAFLREYGDKPEANKQLPRGSSQKIFKYFKERDVLQILKAHE